MGMYTGFVCKVKVKEKYWPLIEFINNSEQLNMDNVWDNAFYKFGFNFIDKYRKISRSDFIPWGGYSAYNEDWLNDYLTQETKTFVNGVWFFGCDLKNYDSTIENFVDIILKEIIEDAYLVRSHYEESYFKDDDYEIDYKLED